MTDKNPQSAHLTIVGSLSLFCTSISSPSPRDKCYLALSTSGKESIPRIHPNTTAPPNQITWNPAAVIIPTNCQRPGGRGLGLTYGIISMPALTAILRDRSALSQFSNSQRPVWAKGVEGGRE